MNSNFNDNLKSPRHGFTLTELLFVIVIIAVLGAMAAGILGKASKDAKFAATRSRITQIEAVMQTVIEDMEVRRLPFRNSQLAAAAGATSRSEVAALRRQVVAAMLQAEFPGPSLDADGQFIPNPAAGMVASVEESITPDSTTGMNFRQWADNRGGNFSNFLQALDDNPTAEMLYWRTVSPLVNTPGEYLYLILERVDIDGTSALESLGPFVVGDTDDDGVPEIVDAFGDPMQLRIVQVIDPTAVGQANWKQFVEINGGIKVPRGYQFLDPVVPRSINDIRFQVLSPNVEADK